MQFSCISCVRSVHVTSTSRVTCITCVIMRVTLDVDVTKRESPRVWSCLGLSLFVKKMKL